MKPPIKYGLLVTLGAIAWVVVAHLLVPDPRSQVHNLGAGIFFNILHITGIYLAIAALRNETGGEMTFKEGLKTGVTTAVIFAISFCLFFAVAIFVVGAKLMPTEPGDDAGAQVAGAFLGLGVVTIIFGLIYSTLISFFLAKRRSATD